MFNAGVVQKWHGNGGCAAWLACVSGLAIIMHACMCVPVGFPALVSECLCMPNYHVSLLHNILRPFSLRRINADFAQRISRGRYYGSRNKLFAGTAVTTQVCKNVGARPESETLPNAV